MRILSFGSRSVNYAVLSDNQRVMYSSHVILRDVDMYDSHKRVAWEPRCVFMPLRVRPIALRTALQGCLEPVLSADFVSSSPL